MGKGKEIKKKGRRMPGHKNLTSITGIGDDSLEYDRGYWGLQRPEEAGGVRGDCAACLCLQRNGALRQDNEDGQQDSADGARAIGAGRHTIQPVSSKFLPEAEGEEGKRQGNHRHGEETADDHLQDVEI